MSGSPEVYGVADLALLTQSAGPLKDLHPPARLAVFGDPVSHSASPPMHNAALKARGHDLQYVRIRVTQDELPEALKNLAGAGFLGASLTIPHKQAALPLMNEVSPAAKLMGAVNTVRLAEGKLQGHNTDGPGLSAAIREEFGISLKDLRVLILGGAGGAGRAITVQCALEGCTSITIANRTPGKGALLATDIREAIGTDIQSIALTPEALGKALPSCDLVINATPLGMKADDTSPLPDGLLSSKHLVYDTIYSGGETPLLKQAHLSGARSSGGFSMLLHQGALQNNLWFNEPAPLEVMRQSLTALRA